MKNKVEIEYTTEEKKNHASLTALLERKVAENDYVIREIMEPPGDLEGDLAWCVREISQMLTTGETSASYGTTWLFLEQMDKKHKLETGVSGNDI